jgi:CheY-like chemotaxis protein
MKADTPGKSHNAPASCSVWLVEDDEAVRSSLQFSLGVEGYRVEAFHSGIEALAAVAAGRSCCRLILDLLLADTDGLTLLRRLRSAGIKASAIIVTTNPSQAIQRQAAAAGAVIVEKPLMRDALVKAMDDLGCVCSQSASG